MTDERTSAQRLILYCRAGFEGECAQEIAALAAAAGIHGHVRAQRDSAFAEFVAPAGCDEADLRRLADVRALIFARQCGVVFAQLDDLPAHDRLTPLMTALRVRGERYAEVFIEAPDTNEGKALATFCRSFGNALVGAMKNARLLDAGLSRPSMASEALGLLPGATRRLHAFFPQSAKVYLCSNDIARSSAWPQGIPRLKFPREAPSRSTLKLDEALLVLLDEGERERWLKPGMSAVDLGAAPGGWTWQLVRRSLRVTAIDNGPMDAALLQSGLVTHVREDGFRYRPKKPVDWLVCDMVEQPRRVAALIAQWLAEGWCRHAIFNLKLPMKKRYEETRLCLDSLRSELAAHGRGADIRAKQLYHDREEITVFAQSK
ncbi:MAG TPA: 23S rRNA (cytidine(2498)-2'-O)-methyltransferase RlmM [Rudaea sp.]|jgi:23S rRNA (cytidine2498-2'-O)-methyltransferase|uniref:23S rRNA (cytidine(2498)-2'-O)-methyltransferase RlmM n=1 Tax=Rudaea sp. TaxID=2136325 RepID=UPI002F922CD4